MSAQVFCLLLGALMGAIIMGMIWVIVNDVTRRPERRVGQRTNRPEKWYLSRDGWIYADEYAAQEREKPAVVFAKKMEFVEDDLDKAVMKDDLADQMMKDELMKVLKKLDERRERDET